MKDKLEDAIKSLTEKTKGASDAKDALQFSQSVQNLTNAYIGLHSLEKVK